MDLFKPKSAEKQTVEQPSGFKELLESMMSQKMVHHCISVRIIYTYYSWYIHGS